MPATALPTINMFDDVATPHSSFEKSKEGKESVLRQSASILNRGMCASDLGAKVGVEFPSQWLK